MLTTWASIEHRAISSDYNSDEYSTVEDSWCNDPSDGKERFLALLALLALLTSLIISPSLVQQSSRILPFTYNVRSLQSHLPTLRRSPLVHTPPLLPITLTNPSLRKIPWRLSAPQKRRQRKRLRLVDNVIAVVDSALQKQGMGTTRNLERWKEEMPTEQEMRPKDKYTMFDRKEKRYRKGIHSESYPFLWELGFGEFGGKVLWNELC